ncbi:hypothetical protein ACM66B_003475 [Microbotryomycetes sp. NB124-2]
MVKFSVSVAALASIAVVAAQTSGHALIGTSLTSAFLHKLAKRQDIGSTLQDLQSLLRDAITAAQGNGQCSQECSSWVTPIQSCVSTNTNNEDIGLCACQESTVSAMQSCGTCLGSSQGSAAEGVANICSQALSALPSSAQTGGLSGASSSASSAVSSAASSASATASNAAPTSSGPSASAPGTASNTASNTQTSAANTPTNTPTGAANHNGVAVGAVLAVAGLVGAIAL